MTPQAGVVAPAVVATVFDAIAVSEAAPTCGLNEEPPSPPPQADSISPAHARAIGEIRRIVILERVGIGCLAQRVRFGFDATASTNPS